MGGNDIDANHYLDFLQKPGVKPVVALFDSSRHHVDNVLDLLSKVFSSATVPNAFKIVFRNYKSCQPLTEFRETNKTKAKNWN
ncbi:hypothetical protein DdX_15516 [Ditylenchus destructor]|uniref:Uncharacterized protein n=1 Tax=Ditylenchus destructor TaxID=166010 RepID=A0AAD4R0W4_9BILA|nr:hypothetical protein DdX_15516 [Ditylenchus destructor]